MEVEPKFPVRLTLKLLLETLRKGSPTALLLRHNFANNTHPTH
jgi:hypothetical protein